MTARGVPGQLRIAAVVGVAVLASLQIVRTAAVADRDVRPRLAATLWPSHPAVLTDGVLLAIASAAARGHPAPPSTRADLRRIAARAPLSPDPFLIEGAIAETEGRSDAAERLLLEARARDPRSRAARYLLADRFFRTGRVTDALIEMQALVSLQQGGGRPFVNVLAAYARTPGAVPPLKAFLQKYPRVEAAVLFTLADDAANTDLILALANVRELDPDWRPRLISSLATSGEYARAHAIWVRFADGRPGAGLFNPSFRELRSPPPFNWAFPKGREGVTEPDGRGGLELLYYGRANSVLASQLLLLRPGQYRLAMVVEGAGGEDGAVRWLIRCPKTKKRLAELPLREGDNAVTFEVPAGCDAQWLELRGVANDLPRTIEFTIRNLQLTAGAGK
jgi:hypothetical protein